MKPGTVVQVLNGVYKGPATVLDRTRVITDGRGVPVGCHHGEFAGGNYKPMEKGEQVVQYHVNGKIGTEPRSNIGRVRNERKKQGKCDSCEVLMINGVRCHETGCPERWKEQLVACFECGCNFQPDTRYQSTCNDCVAQEVR